MSVFGADEDWLCQTWRKLQQLLIEATPVAPAVPELGHANPGEGPALGLLDSLHPVELFTYERQSTALGVLPQFLGGQKRVVASFSKQLDNVSQGWPSF